MDTEDTAASTQSMHTWYGMLTENKASPGDWHTWLAPTLRWGVSDLLKLMMRVNQYMATKIRLDWKNCADLNVHVSYINATKHNMKTL